VFVCVCVWKGGGGKESWGAPKLESILVECLCNLVYWEFFKMLPSNLSTVTISSRPSHLQHITSLLPSQALSLPSSGNINHLFCLMSLLLFS